MMKALGLILLVGATLWATASFGIAAGLLMAGFTGVYAVKG